MDGHIGIDRATLYEPLFDNSFQLANFLTRIFVSVGLSDSRHARLVSVVNAFADVIPVPVRSVHRSDQLLASREQFHPGFAAILASVASPLATIDAARLTDDRTIPVMRSQWRRVGVACPVSARRTQPYHERQRWHVQLGAALNPSNQFRYVARLPGAARANQLQYTRTLSKRGLHNRAVVAHWSFSSRHDPPWSRVGSLVRQVNTTPSVVVSQAYSYQKNYPIFAMIAAAVWRSRAA